MIKQTKTILFAIVCMAIVFQWQACQKKSDVNENIVYRLKWLLNSGAAGSLYANANGFFHAEGLKVSIRSGGVERNAITELEMGRAQFGVATGDQILRALDKGSPICVLAQLFQKSPMYWMYYKNKLQITSLKDLKGKTIGITFGNEDETIMRALLQKGAINPNDVKFYSVRYDYTPFYTGKVDLWPVYINSNGVVIQEKLKLANKSIGFFSPHDFGIQFVGNSIITSQSLAEKKPDMVRKFCKALFHGWEAALDDKNFDQTITIIQSFDQATDRKLIQKQLMASQPLMKPAPNIPFGKINIKAWKQTEKTLLEQKIISKTVLDKQRMINAVQ